VEFTIAWLAAQTRPTLPVYPETAALLGMRKTAAYEAAAAGTLPVRALRVGGRWMVATAELQRVLGIEPAPATPPAAVAAEGR